MSVDQRRARPVDDLSRRVGRRRRVSRWRRAAWATCATVVILAAALAVASLVSGTRSAPTVGSSTSTGVTSSAH